MAHFGSTSPSTLAEQLELLNPEQRKAAETLDGPLLVIAGPGTGKTQLLSVRAANIVAKRDVAPQNILCLTYTDAGTEAMKKRLVELMGHAGFAIEVATFHSFAHRLASSYPEYFDEPQTLRLASDLQQRQLLNALLEELAPASPLYTSRKENVKANLGEVASAIENLKRMGLTPAELCAIAQQNLESLSYLESHEELLRAIYGPMPRKRAQKEAFIAAFEQTLNELCATAPARLTTFVVDAPGIYKPYLLWLGDLVKSTELIDASGKTGGFQELKKQLKEAGASKAAGAWRLKGHAAAEQSLELAKVYEAYLNAMSERHLCDYQDMITQALRALQDHPAFIEELQERYRYLQVDEFQDTNGSQMRLLRLLCQGIEEPNVMAVGDDDQAIMRFQGASVEGIRQFSLRYHPKIVVLKTNYRSTPALVELGQEVAAHISERLVSGEAKAIGAFATTSEQTTFANYHYSAPEMQYDAVARSIRKKLDSGFMASAQKPEEAIAVIAAKHASLQALIPYLRAYNVPFSYRVNTTLEKIASLQTLLAVLRCVSALATGDIPRAEAELPRIVAAKELGFAPKVCVSLAVLARRSHKGWWEALELSSYPELHELKAQLTEFAAQAPAAPVRELIHTIARPLMAYYAEHASADPLALAEFQSGLRALIKETEAEITAASPQQGPLHLPEVMKTLALMRDYAIQIDASVSLGRSSAVRLTTAHGSKGLEFDLVYLIDADDSTWHAANRNRALLPPNILVGNERDENDMIRLLFVAITRARRLIVFASARGTVVRELQDVVEEAPQEVDEASLAQVIETDWQQSYRLSTPELASLLAPDLSSLQISASVLNDFVTYQEHCKNSSAFIERRMLRLPKPPSDALEFGDLVHRFLEDYADQVLRRGLDAGPLTRRYLKEVRWLDFAPSIVHTLCQRFERIVACFVPTLAERLRGPGRFLTEVVISAHTASGVPLYGKCDVLLLDAATKTARVLDYKTGACRSTKLDRNYQRQLQFYKLLIENSPDFATYRVVETQDLYVEPKNRTQNELEAPIAFAPSSEDVAYIATLVDAAWAHIQRGHFDTSAFEETDAFKELYQARMRAGRKPRGYDTLVQKLYEQWLIDTV